MWWFYVGFGFGFFLISLCREMRPREVRESGEVTETETVERAIQSTTELNLKKIEESILFLSSFELQ